MMVRINKNKGIHKSATRKKDNRGEGIIEQRMDETAVPGSIHVMNLFKKKVKKGERKGRGEI